MIGSTHDQRFGSRAGRAGRRALVALVLGLLPAALQGQEPSAMARGAAVYGNMCGRCHNPRSPLERSDRDWVAIVNHMRIRGNLTGGQVRNVLAFLQATNSDPGRPTAIVSTAEESARHMPVEEPDAPIRHELAERGREIVEARACLGCHVIGRQGGAVGPSLNDVMDRRDLGFLRRKLADPTFDNATSMMPNFGLSREEIDAILAYLATLP